MFSVFPEFKIQVIFFPLSLSLFSFVFYRSVPTSPTFTTAGFRECLTRLCLSSLRFPREQLWTHVLDTLWNTSNTARRSEVQETKKTPQSFDASLFMEGDTVHPYSPFPASRNHMLVSHILTLAVCIRGFFEKELPQVCLVSKYTVRKLGDMSRVRVALV